MTVDITNLKYEIFDCAESTDFSVVSYALDVHCVVKAMEPVIEKSNPDIFEELKQDKHEMTFLAITGFITYTFRRGGVEWAMLELEKRGAYFNQVTPQQFWNSVIRAYAQMLFNEYQEDCSANTWSGSFESWLDSKKG